MAAAETERTGPAELLLTNANVITMDATRPAARAVAIRQGRILAVGTDDEVGRWAGPATATRGTPWACAVSWQLRHAAT